MSKEGVQLATITQEELDHFRLQQTLLQQYQQYEQAYQGVRPSPPPPASGLGNPGPLGLAGFAMTTMVLSIVNTGVIIDPKLEGVVLPLALFYGGIAQFVAGIFEFKIPNTFGATCFCSYGAFWASFATYVEFVAGTLPAESAHEATGLFLFVWMLFTFYMTVVSYRVSRALFALFVWLSITFILLTIGALANHDPATRAGGWFGMICAANAWYCSFAVVLNSTWGAEYLPIGVYVHKHNLKSSNDLPLSTTKTIN